MKCDYYTIVFEYVLLYRTLILLFVSMNLVSQLISHGTNLLFSSYVHLYSSIYTLLLSRRCFFSSSILWYKK